jgi:hypothetical protein
LEIKEKRPKKTSSATAVDRLRLGILKKSSDLCATGGQATKHFLQLAHLLFHPKALDDRNCQLLEPDSYDSRYCSRNP